MKIDLTGYNIDELLKMLYNKKIILLNINKTDRNHVFFEILDRDYKKIKRYLTNFKVKRTLGKIKSIPKFILANVGVLIGCFLGLGFGIFASQYTWQIFVYGTEELSSGDILTVLSENNIKKGKINLT